MIDHGAFLDLAAQSIDFELTRADAERLEAHLATCPSCRATTQRLRADAEALRRFGWYDAPARVEDAVTGAAVRGPGRGREARRSWAVTLVGAVVVLVLAGGALAGGAVIQQILGERAPTSSVTSPGSPTAPPATPVPSASASKTPSSPTVVPSGFGLNLPWAVTLLATIGAGGARVEDVAVTGDTIVAVGSDHRDAQLRASVWTSTDGTNWHQTVLDAGPLHAATTFNGSFVAVGDGVSARSADGMNWSWTGWQGAESGEQVDVAAGPAGIAALRLSTGDPATIEVLLSRDGASWRKAATLTGICRPAIAATGSAYVIAGNDCGTDPVAAQIWRSADAEAWLRVEPGDAFLPQAAPVTIAAAGPGFVAGGYWRDADRIRQAFWSSPDGKTWRRRGTFGPPGGIEEIRDVTALGEGAIAVGQRDPDTTNAPTAWASPDGITWARAALLPLASGGSPGSQVINAVASSQNLVVAVGWQVTDDGERPVVWTAPAPTGP